MHVAVCIVGYRNAADIVACLGALTDSTYGDFEVQICENGGADAYGALVEAIPARLSGGQPVAIIEAPAQPGLCGRRQRLLAGEPEMQTPGGSSTPTLVLTPPRSTPSWSA